MFGIINSNLNFITLSLPFIIPFYHLSNGIRFCSSDFIGNKALTVISRYL